MGRRSGGEEGVGGRKTQRTVGEGVRGRTGEMVIY